MIAAPQRRWFQFRLRTLFVVVTVAAAGGGWVASELNIARHRIQERERIRAGGGWVNGTGEAHDLRSDWQQRLHESFGDYEVFSIGLPASANGAEIERVRRLFPDAAIWQRDPGSELGYILRWPIPH